MIVFRCSKCGEALESPDSLVGNHETCTTCGTKTVVPPKKQDKIAETPVLRDSSRPAISRALKHEPAVTGPSVAAAVIPGPEIAGQDDLVILATPPTAHSAPNKAEKSWFNMELALGWGINILSWILFIATGSHVIEFVMGVANLGAAYLGFRNRSTRLLLASVADAAWMFAWAFGVFGSSAGILDLLHLADQLR